MLLIQKPHLNLKKNSNKPASEISWPENVLQTYYRRKTSIFAHSLFWGVFFSFKSCLYTFPILLAPDLVRYLLLISPFWIPGVEKVSNIQHVIVYLPLSIMENPRRQTNKRLVMMFPLALEPVLQAYACHCHFRFHAISFASKILLDKPNRKKMHRTVVVDF